VGGLGGGESSWGGVGGGVGGRGSSGGGGGVGWWLMSVRVWGLGVGGVWGGWRDW